MKCGAEIKDFCRLIDLFSNINGALLFNIDMRLIFLQSYKTGIESTEQYHYYTAKILQETCCGLQSCCIIAVEVLRDTYEETTLKDFAESLRKQL